MEQTEIEKIKQKNSDFLQTFRGSEQGQRVYDLLAEFCLKNECTFDRDSARKSDFNTGARAVILEIDYWMEYDLSTLEDVNETENVSPEDNSN